MKELNHQEIQSISAGFGPFVEGLQAAFYTYGALAAVSGFLLGCAVISGAYYLYTNH